MSKKSVLYIAIFSIGVLALISSLLHHYYMRGEVIQYGFHGKAGIYDKAGIIIGAIFIVIGLILFIFNKYKMCERKGIFSAKVNFFEALLVVILVTLSSGIAGVLYGYYNRASVAGRHGKWSIGIYISSSHEPFNFTGENVDNPVLTVDDVTDVQAILVADPFLVHESDAYYMFFEVWNADTDQGDIGLAISNDGFDWTYKRIVLDEYFVLAYPCVFKWNNEYYMIPETHQTRSVRLYKAKDFPYTWSFFKILLKGRDFVDNTIFYYNNMWWLFTETRNNDLLRLYYCETPLGPWTEHPESPIIEGDANIARPGGNVIVFDNRIVRYTQDDDPYYGNQVWAFEITTLTTKNYEERRIGSRPILKGFDNWNTRGMHTISACRVGGNRWIASVDGY